MKPSIQQLESFYWIARLGSVHAAARHQHLTQPALTARLRELEDIIGTKLFDRSGYRAELTPAGRELLVYAEKILQLSDEMLNLPGIANPVHGLLRLGVNESTAMVGLSNLLTRVKAMYPALKIELTVEIGATLSKKLNARELDIAILTNPVSAPHITDEALGSAELNWIASVSQKFTSKVLTPRDMAELAILTLPPQSALHEVVTEWFRSGSCRFDQSGHCNSLALIMDLVAAGHGIAILPRSIVQKKLAHGVVQLLTVTPALPKASYFVSYVQEVSHLARNTLIPLARTTLSEAGLFDIA